MLSRAAADLACGLFVRRVLSGAVQAGSENLHTTHYAVVDAEGNAICVTYTLSNRYGKGITVPGLGFLLNNEMDDFSSKPGAANAFGLV